MSKYTHNLVKYVEIYPDFRENVCNFVEFRDRGSEFRKYVRNFVNMRE